jgi:alpha-methylacyl-CoA racemase
MLGNAREARVWTDPARPMFRWSRVFVSIGEAPQHPHNKLRRTYVEIDGIVQPAPAPRFSRTVPDLPIPPQPPSDPDGAEAALAPWLDPAEIPALRAAGTLG